MLAAGPSLSSAIGSAILFGLLFVAGAVAFGCYLAVEVVKSKVAGALTVIGLLLVSVAVVGGITVLLYHAAWIDFRRGTQHCMGGCT